MRRRFSFESLDRRLAPSTITVTAEVAGIDSPPTYPPTCPYPPGDPAPPLLPPTEPGGPSEPA